MRILEFDCKLARGILKNKSRTMIIYSLPQDFIDEIKLNIDQDYCRLSVHFHWGHNVETMKGAIYFLKTFQLNKSLLSLL